MADVVQGVITLLSATAGVTSLTSTRITPAYAPMGTTPEYIVVDMNGTEPQYHSTAEAGLHRSQVSVKCYGNNMLEAINLAEQVRLALSGKPAGSLGGINARRTTVDDIRDAYSGPSGEGDEIGHPAREVLLTIWHNATIPTFP